MSDVRLLELAGRQHRCVARRQLLALGYSDKAIAHRLAGGRLVQLHDGVYAVAPVLDERSTRWMAATLTAPDSVLSHASAAAAWGFRACNAPFEVITRRGSGGPERKDDVLVCRSQTVDATTLEGIPITTPERTLIDLAPRLHERALARAVREAMRLRTTTPSDVFITLALLRDAGHSAPGVNEEIEGEEADLSWPDRRLIVELDGPQFHLDASEDQRKQGIWETAGWTVRRLPTDAVYLDPGRLTALL